MIWALTGVIFFSVLLVVVALARLIRPGLESTQEATSRRLEKLLNTTAVNDFSAEAIMRHSSLSEIGFLDNLLAKARRLTSIKELLEKAGSPMNLGTLILLAAVMAMLGILTGVIMKLGLLIIPLALLGGFSPFILLKKLKDRRMAVFETQFPEAVELMGRALRAGHSFSSGLQMAASELPEPVSSEFAKTFEDYSYGKTMEDSLGGLVKRVDNADVRFFAAAVALQRETGGNLTEVLDNISHIIRERFRLLRTVKTLSAEGRLSGTILALMPPALFVMLYFTSPGYINMALEHPIGQATLMIGAAFEVLGIFVIKFIIKMDA
ncbi:type II secretion system F family protein [Dethiosulfatarculus sandiegensis]|uniref:type II secretion system F family protein n=1 Tax=Dethiosulfatarculus sandiegensis TaxID=1429043 RepID=UPI000A989204|nr:type II secretion system F family protein [Dethiosulfatarculus sandiegensis]